ncbi:MAG: protein kinase [Candidatus Sumerlaeia bacterium]|nr:protein kinase [Candidatus Sumerlaeia bacterium]
MTSTDTLDTNGFPKDLPKDPQESYRHEPSTEWRKRRPVSSEAGALTTWGVRRTSAEQDTVGLARSGEHVDGQAAGDPSLAAHHDVTYILRQCVGMGGFGEVWEAIQVSLGRTVAVKKIQDTHYDEIRDDEEETLLLDNQFRQEAYITAQLDHPNIVPIYDLGTDEHGHPLLAMKMVKGTPWNQLLRSDSDQMDFDDFLHKHLTILISAAQAVAFAHSRRIVHRDLKPSQVIVGEFGEVLLMDWGLAVFVGDLEEDLRTLSELKSHIPTPVTASSPGGTPCLMAPEQTQPTAEEIDTYTDIYLLGGCLYFVLTGTYPHDDRTSFLSMARARKGEVTDPRERVSGRYIPAELAELAMHCLRKRPADRLVSAEEFIRRIQDYLSGSTNRRESVRLTARVADRLVALDTGIHSLESRERVATLLDREGKDEDSNCYAAFTECLNLLQQALAKWSRNPDVETLREMVLSRYARKAIAHGDLTLACALADQFQDREEAANVHRQVEQLHLRTRRVHQQRRLAVAGALLLMAVLVAGGFRYALDQRSAAQSLALERDVARNHREAADRARYRATLEQYFSSIGIAEITTDEGRFEKARQILFERIPAGFAHWEWGHLLARLHPEDLVLAEPNVFHAVFSPDGHAVLTGTMSGLSRWDARLGRHLWTTRTNERLVWAIAVSRDGSLVAGASRDNSGVLLNAQTGELHHRLEGHERFLRSIDISPDNAVVVTTGADRSMRFWDTATGEQTRALTDLPADVYVIRYSPDGSQLLGGTMNRRAMLWDATTGDVVREFLGHEENVLGVAFTDDGKHVLTVSSDRTLRIFDAATGELLRHASNPNTYLHDLDVSPDGKVVATADDLGVCRLWDFETLSLLTEVQADDPMWRVRFAPSGDRLLTTSRRSVRILHMDRVLPRPRLNSAPMPAELRAATKVLPVFGAVPVRDPAWRDRDRPWLVPSGATLATLNNDTFAIVSAQSDFSPDFSRRVDVGRESRAVTVHAVADGTQLAKLGDDTALLARFSPNGRVIAVGDYAEHIRLYDAADYSLLHDLQRPAGIRIDPSRPEDLVRMIEFSPDGRFLAAMYNDDELVLWDVARGTIHLQFERASRGGIALRFSADGSLLAGGGTDDQVPVWDTQTGKLRLLLNGHQRAIISIDFSPDNERIVTASKDLTVKIWDARTGRELITPYRDPRGETIIGARFIRDGRDILLASTDGGIRVLETFPWIPGDYPRNDTVELTEAQRIEWWKRQRRLTPEAALEDVLTPDFEAVRRQIDLLPR